MGTVFDLLEYQYCTTSGLPPKQAGDYYIWIDDEQGRSDEKLFLRISEITLDRQSAGALLISGFDVLPGQRVHVVYVLGRSEYVIYEALETALSKSKFPWKYAKVPKYQPSVATSKELC